MAETKANIPVPAGLPDMSKINYTDVTPDEAKNIQASTEKYLQDLENRYAQPNWWKVAAGFAKPQLGGFMASLGSAADALGEGVEQQRAIAPSISLMRAQLAQQGIGMKQGQTAAQEYADWEKLPEAERMKKLPNLAARMASLGSPKADAANKLLEGSRAQQASDISGLTLFVNQKNTDRQLAKELLESKSIPLSEYTARIKEIDSRKPPSFITSQSLDKTVEQGDKLPSAGGGLPPPTSMIAPTESLGAGESIVEKKPKTVLSSPLNLGEEVGMTATQIAARAKQAEDYQKQGNDTYTSLQKIAAPSNFSDLVTPVDNALGLLGWEKEGQEKAANQANARKTMNVLSGGPFNALLASLNEGVGGKVGDLYANINAPVEKFVRANFPPELQTYAKDLALNLAKVSIAQQRLGGVSQSSGRNVEYELYGQSSPSMSSDPVSALKALLHLKTSLYNAKAHHDFISQIDVGKHPEYSVDSASPTRLYDITNSEPYRNLSTPWLKQHADIERGFGSKRKTP